MERDTTNVESTAPSVNEEALRLLDSDPAAYFERTHKPLPVGYAGPARLTEAVELLKAGRADEYYRSLRKD